MFFLKCIFYVSENRYISKLDIKLNIIKSLKNYVSNVIPSNLNNIKLNLRKGPYGYLRKSKVFFTNQESSFFDQWHVHDG